MSPDVYNGAWTVEVNALQACFPHCKKETGVSNKDNASRHSVAMAWVGFKDTARWDDYKWYMEQFTHSIAPAAAETLDLKTLPPPGRASGHLMFVAKAGQGGEFSMEVSGNTYVLRSRMEELEVGGQVPAFLGFVRNSCRCFLCDKRKS